MSSNVRRRRRTIEERLGAAVRHLRPGDLAGRGEPLPRDRGATRVSGGGPDEGGARGSHIEHVTLEAAASQTIASGGAGVSWGQIVGPPTERAGFETLSARIAADGSVVAIPIDVTGDLEIVLSGRWGDYPSGFRCSGTITFTRTRAGVTATKSKTLTPAARNFDDVLIAWDVRTGDHITITLPNDSGSSQTLAEAEIGLRVIEVAEIAAPPVLIGTSHGFGDGPSRPTAATVDGIPAIRAGDLLVAYVSSTEPTITPPAGWTQITLDGSGDFRHALYTRTAQAGDDTASWTWSATGGSGGQLTIHVLMAVLPGVTLAQSDLTFQLAGATSMAAQVITGSNAWLLMFGGTSGTSAVTHSVAGMDLVRLEQDEYTSSSGGTAVISLFDGGWLPAGTHDFTLTMSATTAGGVALIAVS